MLKGWSRSLRRHLPVLAVLCFGVLISFFCFLFLRSLETEKAETAFQRVAQERFDDLQSDLHETVSQVVALGAFCESSYPVTLTSFNSFVQPLLASHDPGIQALGWAPRVTSGERSAFEKSGRAGGFAGFEIRDRLEPVQAGKRPPEPARMARAGDRPVYFPVLYVQPYAGNEAAHGFDLFSGPRRRDAIQRAIKSGELTATGRITLVQETGNQYGALIYRPVYRRSGDRRELLGIALGVMRISNVVERRGVTSGIDLVIRDLSASPAEQQMYPSVVDGTPQTSRFSGYLTITVGGRNWQIAASPMPGAFPVSKTYSYAGCAVCLLFTLLAAVYVAENSGRRWKIESLVEERTSALNAALTSLAELHRGREESEARYRCLVDDSPGAIVVEREGKIVLVNRACVEMFAGFDATKDSEDHSVMEFVAPGRETAAREMIERFYAQDMQISPREVQLLRRDGSIFDAEIAASSFSQNGQRTIQVVLRDISQRKQKEAENARLVGAIEQAGESILIMDLTGKIVYVNPAFERISGYSRAEALGKNPRFLQSGLLSDDYYANFWAQLRSGESWKGRLVNRTKSGRVYTEEAAISPVCDRLGEIINFVSVKRDVTLEIELQEKLHQSQKMDAIGRLAGGVAHDFNNMLMVIVSYAELIAESLPEGARLRDHTQQILRAAGRSASLTRQLLAFSRKQVLAPQVLDCNKIVTETASMVRRLISENIDLKCDLTPDLWRVKADADQIAQVILNLCVNSRDAMPDGGALVLTTRNLRLDQGFVEISVSDTGVGISSEMQANLFEPFFTTKERGKGTGLGLATVYGIVQQSGGHVRVKSSSGRGATFTISLPRCQEEAPPPEATPRISRTSGTGRLVLVAEDEDALREAITESLRNHGYQVLAASNGVEALDILESQPNVSILVSDIIMPRMGGRELASLAARQLPHLQIIFMSGYADHEFSLDDGGEPPFLYLQKPFPMEQLLTRIAELNPRAEQMDLTLGQPPRS